MKTIKLVTALLAFVVLAAGCEQQGIAQLDNLQVSPSYIAIPTDGGSVDAEFTANTDWTMDFNVTIDGDKYLDDEKGVITPKKEVSQLDAPDNNWFTVSQRSGSNGKVKVTFSAPKATDSHSTTIKVKVGDYYQYLIVSQTMGPVELPESTVKEISVVPDGTQVKVTGTCTSITSTQYGNWYLKDAAGDVILIYGTLDASGSYNWSSANIAVGDIVTVQGPKKLYNSTLELVDVSVNKVKKALLISNDGNKTVDKAASKIPVKLTNKGTALSYESSVEWITVDSGFSQDGNEMTFNLLLSANETGKIRDGVVTFKATKGDDFTEFPVQVKQVASSPVDGGLAVISEAVAKGTSKSPVSFDVNLENAVVKYRSGGNIFIEDKTGGLLIYDGESKLKAGSVVNGRVFGQGYAYSKLPEATVFNLSFAKVTDEGSTEPTEVKLSDLMANYNKYLSRYIILKGVKLSAAIDVVYSKVKSSGKITDGANSIAIYPQSSGKFNGSKIYFYLNVPAEKTIDIVTIPGINNTTRQLNLYTPSWVEVCE